MTDMKELYESIIGCQKCPRLRQVTPIPYPWSIFAEDKSQVELLVIGRNPGLEHDYTNVSSSGFQDIYRQRYVQSRFGKYLESKLGETFWLKTAITNLCKCSSPENSPLTPEEIGNCSSYTSQIILALKPKIILLVGKDACKYTFPVDLSNWMGEEEYVTLASGVNIFMVYHPSFLNRGAKEVFHGLNDGKFSIIKEMLQV